METAKRLYNLSCRFNAMAVTRNKFYALAAGFNFVVPKQASGISPDVLSAVWDPKSRVREGGQDFGVFVREAAAGGSNQTLTILVVESDSIAAATIPDSTVATTQMNYVGILAGPSFNADGFDIANVSKFYHIYEQVASA